MAGLLRSTPNTADSVGNYGSSITIEELYPAGPDFKLRKVVLLGPSLPFMGAEWGFENNMITDWYPGNAVEATQQVLGPRELPSSWQGEWNRTRMGTTPTIYVDEHGATQRIVSPHVLREVLESIFRDGQRLRVTWSATGTQNVGGRDNVDDHGIWKKQAVNVQILREGRVKTFKTPIDRHTDIKWSAEFHWLGRGGKQDKAVDAATSGTNAATASNALQASVNATMVATKTKIQQLKSTTPRSASVFTLGQLESLAAAPSKLVGDFTRKIQQTVSTFKRLGDVALKLRSQPFAVANSVVDLARNTSNVANQFVDEMGRKPPEQLTLKTKVSDMLRGANYFNGVVAAAQLNSRRGQELDNATRQVLLAGSNRGVLSVRESQASRAGDILAIYVTKTGDTPQVVSRKFYQNADHGVDVLRANRMPWYTPKFRPGQILVIPALSSALARSRT